MSKPTLYRVCDGTCPSCQRMGYEHHYVPVEPDEIGAVLRRCLPLITDRQVLDVLDALGVGGDDE